MTTPLTSTDTGLRAPLLVGAGGLALAAALHFRDPHVSGSWGFCPSKLILGIDCPGCGGLRAVNLLTHGDVVGAISSNLIAVALAGFLAVAWVVWFVRRARGQAAQFVSIQPAWAWLLLAAVITFGVVRLTPWGAWLAP